MLINNHGLGFYLHKLVDLIKNLLLAVCGLEDSIKLELEATVRMLQGSCHTLKSQEIFLLERIRHRKDGWNDE